MFPVICHLFYFECNDKNQCNIRIQLLYFGWWLEDNTVHNTGAVSLQSWVCVFVIEKCVCVMPDLPASASLP